MAKERKIIVNIGLPGSFIDKVDDARKNIPRSEVLRDFLLNNKEQLFKELTA